ncbi:prolyl oligopeptidase family serine peptidase [Croceicoccus sp. F390]|uniref:prolyl oligopeptidase n=1 Tax=Croceicoccus esteveae TaxID=3075597 RepID=A0ABU2ZEF4_9SPHN|nr:prolyl oligopeptidase family serine peptidase [Croceicoccus sp. F390]MDT0574741.1 prolyl oligopeptidase family serine peptidase [Croceicoccus sp. F390]
MAKRAAGLLAAASILSLAAVPAQADHHQPGEQRQMTGFDRQSYPQTRRDNVVEEQFGERIADPYRWLEADVRNDAKVADWVKRQSSFADTYLKTLPERAFFEQALSELLDYERFGTPVKAGDRLLFEHNDGLQNQNVLKIVDADVATIDGLGRTLIDPNQWSDDGTTALAGWKASPDGGIVAYQVQKGGSDWRTLRFVSTADGQVLEDKLDWAKFTGISWVGNDAVLYSRFPEPAAGQDFQALNYNQAVFYHKLGTPQSSDRQVYATPDAQKLGHGASVTSDGRWVVINSNEGTDPASIVTLLPIGRGSWTPITLVAEQADQWDLVDGIGDRLWFVTSKNAPLKKIVLVDLSGDAPVITDVVPQAQENLESAAIVGDRIVTSYLQDAASRLRLFSLDGEPQGMVQLGGFGTAGGISGEPGDEDAWISYSSFTQPQTVLKLDTNSGRVQDFAAVAASFDPDDFATEQVFYSSKDGTRVPMFIVKRKDVTGPAPTLLYGYGGFNISLTPSYSASRMAWLRGGGVYALANLRGGGEYGAEWHDAGRGANKQNVFDDFIAAGEWLKSNGITGENQLAIDGRSNGGLLMGAVTNQRPDLFDAVHAAVGVMDMLRFDRWTAGRYWVDDYGYPDREADWRVLRGYSPYHNIRSGLEYPAVLTTTADTDDRVVPGHSFKYAAALQHADIGEKPHLIRIETNAGHGSGKPVSKIIEEFSDILGFLAHWTDFSPAAPQ